MIIKTLDPELCSRHLKKSDVAALIGVLAVLQDHALAGELDGRLAVRLGQRVGSLAQSAGLEAALDALNQRLRYVLGEYDEPPAMG